VTTDPVRGAAYHCLALYALSLLGAFTIGLALGLSL
jgi:hypothetical protein